MKLSARAKRGMRLLIRRRWGDAGLTRYESIQHTFNHLCRRFIPSLREPDLAYLTRLVTPGSVCLDIGANVGTYTAFLSQIVGPDGIVLAYEPVAYTFDVLERVCERLRLRNVRLHRAAVSDVEGFADIVVPALPNAANAPRLDTPSAYLNAGEQITGHRETVPVVTLDGMLPAPRRVAFIKCDTEGAELSVMRGAVRLLAVHKPVVLCEIAARLTARYGHRPEDVFGFFASHGYAAYRLDGGELVGVSASSDVPGNYWFLPVGTE